MSERRVEICVADVASAAASKAGGADRIELCADLGSGGITPSAGLLSHVVASIGIATHVLIRPRGGDFAYSTEELDVMIRDIAVAKACGASGVVFGALRSDGTIDLEATARLLEASRPMSTTFHKAVDLTPDPIGTIDVLCAMEIDRVLTSGGRGRARDNVWTLRAMVDRAAGRTVVMAGGGIVDEDVVDLIREAGIDEFHLGSGVTEPAAPPGPFGAAPARVVAEKVARVVRLVRSG